MSLINFQGLNTKTVKMGLGRSDFATDGPYQYFIYRAGCDDTFIENYLSSFTLYILKKPPNANLIINGLSVLVEEGDAIQFESESAKLTFKGNGIEVLIAGINKVCSYKKGIFHTHASEIYKVIKPWGYELWLNGQHEGYAIKQIYISLGNKTSLQYHNFKQETNVLFCGILKLHYKSKSNISNDKVNNSHISTIEINPITSIDVLPQTLHRIEAITNVLLFETSTPHLDDVVRVSDDSKRGHGRIEEEHSK